MKSCIASTDSRFARHVAGLARVRPRRQSYGSCLAKSPVYFFPDGFNGVTSLMGSMVTNLVKESREAKVKKDDSQGRRHCSHTCNRSERALVCDAENNCALASHSSGAHVLVFSVLVCKWRLHTNEVFG